MQRLRVPLNATIRQLICDALVRLLALGFALGLALALAPEPAAAQAATCDAPQSRDDGWKVAPPERVGLDPAVLCLLVPRFDAWKEADLHAVLVVRHGTLVFEHYFKGVDEHWGRSLGIVTFGPGVKHDLRSITKSITSLLLGFAIDRG